MNSKKFTPEPSNCNNKWCKNNYSDLPASGTHSSISKCGNIQAIIHDRNTRGGITGRGVTICPFGFIKSEQKISPFSTKMATNSVLLYNDKRPGYLPPQGQFRSLTRIGYEYRN